MSRQVLIADGNAGRARRLAEACASAGVEAKRAPHGAAALEMALSCPPHLILAADGLPLVDARKLLEILRANPHTRKARFIFLEDDDHPVKHRLGEWRLPVDAPTEELVKRIQEAMDRQDRMDSVDERAEDGGAVEGELTQLPLSDLLQLFHVNQRSGRLDLSRDAEGDDDTEGRILVSEGDVIRAEVGSTEGEKALFRMLAWPLGRFSFVPEPCIESPAIFAPTRALLAEGLRQIDEWDRLAPRLPPMDSPLRLKVKPSELPNIVHPLTQEVLQLLETYSRVRDVVDQCSFPDYQVLRTLHTLSERGIVQIGQVRISPPSRTNEGLFNDAQTRRLKDWLREESPRDGEIPRAKIIVAAARPEGVVDFVNLLRATPQVAVEPAFATASVPADALQRIARVDVDGELGVDLFHLPRDERFAPLWARAGHGSLGVLFLLSGPLAEAAEAVREMAEVLKTLPRSRLFHVAVLRKDEGVSADELRDHTALIDEIALYLLSLESDKEPSALLRGLLARMVP